MGAIIGSDRVTKQGAAECGAFIRLEHDGSPSLGQFFFFDATGAVQSSSADEFDDLSHLIAIEPDAVLAADVDDHAGPVGVIGSAHQIAACGA